MPVNASGSGSSPTLQGATPSLPDQSGTSGASKRSCCRSGHPQAETLRGAALSQQQEVRDGRRPRSHRRTCLQTVPSQLNGQDPIEVGPDQTGSFRFIAVEAQMDWRRDETWGHPAVEFTWEGQR
jgi:hypothetical protein